MTYKVYISLPDALRVMDQLQKEDLKTSGDTPFTFDAERAKNALNNLTKYTGMIKPVRCKVCAHSKESLGIFYSCKENPGGYLGDDGYCSLGKLDPVKLVAEIQKEDQNSEV